VVVLTTSKTTTTGVLAVLSDTSLTGGNVTAAELQVSPSNVRYNIVLISSGSRAAADKGRLL
jgi:hypothetical protein